MQDADGDEIDMEDDLAESAVQEDNSHRSANSSVELSNSNINNRSSAMKSRNDTSKNQVITESDGYF